MKSLHLILYSIGTISVLAAIYGWIRTGSFWDHYFGIFIGFTLIITSRLHQSGKLK